MIEYYGSDQCESCVETLRFIQQTPFEFKYVDVETIKFEGIIPRLVFEDRTEIIGPEAIKQYIKNWMQKEFKPYIPQKEPVETRWTRYD